MDVSSTIDKYVERERAIVRRINKNEHMYMSSVRLTCIETRRPSNIQKKTNEIKSVLCCQA